MKKKLGQRLGIKILKRVALGAVDTVAPIKGVASGVVNGVKQVISENKSSNEGGEGKIDWVRLSTSIGIIALALAVTFGLIDIKLFKELVRALMDV